MVQSQTNTSGFMINGNAGAGVFGVNKLDNNKISDKGYSIFTGGITAEVGLGYAITDYLAVLSGIRIQAFNQHFVYEEEEYTYSGGRYIIPLSFTVFYGDNVFRPFVDIGAYYILGASDVLVNRSQSEQMAQPFGDFGMHASFGFYRKFTDRWYYVMKFHLAQDQTDQGLQLTEATFSTGVSWRFL